MMLTSGDGTLEFTGHTEITSTLLTSITGWILLSLSTLDSVAPAGSASLFTSELWLNSTITRPGKDGFKSCLTAASREKNVPKMLYSMELIRSMKTVNVEIVKEKMYLRTLLKLLRNLPSTKTQPALSSTCPLLQKARSSDLPSINTILNKDVVPFL